MIVKSFLSLFFFTRVPIKKKLFTLPHTIKSACLSSKSCELEPLLVIFTVTALCNFPLKIHYAMGRSSFPFFTISDFSRSALSTLFFFAHCKKIYT